MRSTPYVRPPSKKMLAHLKRVHELVHKLVKERTKARRAAAAEKAQKIAEAAEAKKAKARARYAAKKSTTPQSIAS